MKRTTAILLALVMVLAFCACKKHEHTWKEATCTEPKTCTECGAVEGAPLGHTWKDATCTLPKTCSVCGATEGEALGHAWKDATCTSPKTCSVCGATEGEALGHDPVWETVAADNVAAVRTMKQVCRTCGETLETKEEPIDSFIDGESFALTAEEFVERLQNVWDDQRKDAFVLKFKYSVNSSGKINFDFFNQHDVWLGWGLFYDNAGIAIDGNAKDVPIHAIRVIAGPVDEFSVETLFYLFRQLVGPCTMAIDPTIKTVGMYEEPILKNHYTDDGQSLNGLNYTCLYDEEGGLFKLDIDIAK